MTDYYFKDLNRLVVALVGEEHSDLWWNSPNKAFNDSPPLSYMNEAEWTKVRDYLMFHAYCGGGS